VRSSLASTASKAPSLRSPESPSRVLEREITALVRVLGAGLLAIPGCGVLSAAKIIGETAGASRFRSKATFVRRNGSAPIPVWSSNTIRHPLSRVGNRQVNAALHRIAVTQWRGGAGAWLHRASHRGG
jgi:transposase